MSGRKKYENMEPWKSQSCDLSVLKKGHLTSTSPVAQLQKQDLVERQGKEKSCGHSLYDAFDH